MVVKTIDYDVVSEIAGHQPNKGVAVEIAAENIYGLCKNKGMECAVDGKFVEFDTVSELKDKLEQAEGMSVRVFDVNIGG